jgi:hypothetical protein
MLEQENRHVDARVAREIAGNFDSPAFVCLLAAAAALKEDLIDKEDGQPADPQEIREAMQQYTGTPVKNWFVNRVLGLLHAIAGEEFAEDPEHFRRMVCAICDGDPLSAEETEEDLDVDEILWALYQVSLTAPDDDNPAKQLSERVKEFIAERIDDEAQDDELPPGFDEYDEIPHYVDLILLEEKKDLAERLRGAGYSDDDLRLLDPDLIVLLNGEEELKDQLSQSE